MSKIEEKMGESVKIELDYESTEKLRSRIWRYRDTWGKELHRSDLVYCPLKAYCRLTGIEAKPREKVVESWIVGTAIHEVIQRAFKEKEIKVSNGVIEAHLDTRYRGCPLEIKTTVLTISRPSEIPDEYIQQLIYGMILEGKRTGYLLTLDIVNKTILVWKVRLTTTEWEDWRDRMIVERSKILEAVQSRNPFILKPQIGECSTCPYCYPDGCPLAKGIEGLCRP